VDKVHQTQNYDPGKNILYTILCRPPVGDVSSKKRKLMRHRRNDLSIVYREDREAYSVDLE